MTRIALFVAGFGLLGAGCSTYSPPAGTTSRTPAVAASVSTVRLTAAQTDIVRAHFRGSDNGRGRGKVRNGGLPPGIAKNLARGKPLPPGIAKRYLPSELLVRIPRAPDGLEYVVVGGKLLLVEIATQVVREVLLETVFG